MPKASDLVASFSKMIDTQVWRAGQRLPPERELCEQFGSARNTVRRALTMLEREARIVRHTGRGCFVSETAAALPAAMISDFLGDMSRAGPADILELRMIVEPMAASIAAVRATARDIEAIERAARLIERAENLGDREDADANFHLALFQATRNPLLISLCAAINTVRDRSEWFERKRQILTPDRKNLYDHQHGEIVAALRRRDAGEVQTAMRSHLETLRRDILGQYLS